MRIVSLWPYLSASIEWVADGVVLTVGMVLAVYKVFTVEDQEI